MIAFTSILWDFLAHLHTVSEKCYKLKTLLSLLFQLRFFTVVEDTVKYINLKACCVYYKEY